MVEDTLKARGEVYGDFSSGSKGIANIMCTLKMLHLSTNGVQMSEEDSVQLMFQVIKLVRLASTPSHIDSWHDIQGYGALSELHYKNKGDSK